jgi:hypothetical protein
MSTNKEIYDIDLNIPRFSIDKFYSKKGFKHWKGVFEEYSMCTDRFIRVVSEQYKETEYTDAPYWNNERTNIGMLAASCWKNGWIALEEFSTDKKNGSGRCDLWVSSQSGKKNYAIEAKKDHSALGTGDEVKRLEKFLSEACDDAEKLSEDEGEERMGIAFIHLYINKNKMANANEIFNSLLIELRNLSNAKDGPDFVYIYLKDNKVESDKSIIPGVIIAGKIV